MAGAEPVAITVDPKDMVGCGRAFRQLSSELQSKVIVLALNRTGDACFTQLKRIAADKSGRSISYAAAHITKKVAYGSKLQYEMKVHDWWSKITAGDFRAREAGDAVTHRAWQGGMIGHSFMIGDVALHRPPGQKLKPLYGPNVAREVERNIKEVEKMVREKMKTVFVARFHYQMDRLVAQSANANGLKSATHAVADLREAFG